MNVWRTVHPTTEPVTLARAAVQCRFDYLGESPPHPDEAVISGLITSARELAEAFTGMTLAPSTWELRRDRFADFMPLPYGPVTGVVSVKYVDTAGVEQTLDPSVYVLDSRPFGTGVRLAYNETWPDVRCEANAVRITYTAGPTDGESPNPYPIPTPIVQAMLLTIGDGFENREDTLVGVTALELPHGAEYLMRRYREPGL